MATLGLHEATNPTRPTKVMQNSGHILPFAQVDTSTVRRTSTRRYVQESNLECPAKPGSKKTRSSILLHMWLPDEILKDYRINTRAREGFIGRSSREASRYIGRSTSKAQGLTFISRTAATGENGPIWLLPALPRPQQKR